MITKIKLNIYKHFNGDIDGWARIGTSYQKERITDNDWFLIESLIQDLTLVQKGLTSKTYQNKLNQKLKENCDSWETIQELEKMVGL